MSEKSCIFAPDWAIYFNVHRSNIMENTFLQAIKNGINFPPEGSCEFDSSDHIRFHNGMDVSGHNYNCHRRFVIEKNIEGGEGYTITLYNLDGLHPLWLNNIQMSPKRMRIVATKGNLIEFRGYGYDENALAIGAPFDAASYENYGVVLMIADNEIVRAQLNMYDRNVSIVYLK